MKSFLAVLGMVALVAVAALPQVREAWVRPEARSFDHRYGAALNSTLEQVEALIKAPGPDAKTAHLRKLEAGAFRLMINADRFRRHYDDSAWRQARQKVSDAYKRAEEQIQLSRGIAPAACERMLEQIRRYRDTLDIHDAEASSINWNTALSSNAGEGNPLEDDAPITDTFDQDDDGCDGH